MPLDILEPVALRRVVEKFTAPEKMTMLNMVPRESHPWPSATWDVLQGARAIAELNVPNSEANIVPQRSRAQQTASFAYIREKKNFTPTTVMWIRKVANSIGDLSVLQSAEQHVVREIQDLNTRADNRAEWMLWQSLTGNLTYNNPEAGVIVSVDYLFPASHKPTVGTSWATATANQIVDDVRAWKQLVARDGQVSPADAFATETTLARIFKAFTAAGASAHYGGLLSDRMKDEYYKSGAISGFMGLNWQVQESTYDVAGDAYTSTELIYPSAQTPFLAENAIVLGNFKTNRPIELFEGPSADFAAGNAYTGKFVKTWQDEDPSGRQALLEWHLLPVITRPEQFVYVNTVV